MSQPGAGRTDFGALTGLRSGKRTFYREYLRSAQRLESTIRALDRISAALVRTTEGSRTLVEAVVHAAAEHLRADWLLFAIAEGALPAARPRFLLLSGGTLTDDERAFTDEIAEQLGVLRQRPWEAESQLTGQGWVRAPMTLDGEPVGGIVGAPSVGVEVADTDLAILRVLANQAAVALHNSFLMHATTRLRGRTEQLTEAAAQQARDLAARNAELAETQRRLVDAMQHQVIDDERHRIARELHDSVTQDVLSAGMTIEICRAELAELDGMADADTGRLVNRMSTAKDLTRGAVERLRAAIYSLHNGSAEPAGSLPVLLQRLSTVHIPNDLRVSVQVLGEPVSLPPEAEHSLLRLTGEALFNTVSHARASRAAVRLRYSDERVVLTISDDGVGDPAHLRRTLRLAMATGFGGRHQGLANMRTRAEELGGTLTIRRARIGGVMLRLEIPLPLVMRARQPR